MRKKVTINENHQKGLSHLMTKPFSTSEKEDIKAARKKVGVDRPMFYHDAVVAYANKINGETNG